MVEIDDLRDIRQSRIGRLVDRMIEARPAVQQQHGRLLVHDRTVGDELCALDVEEQTHAVHQNMHWPAILHPIRLQV